MPSNVPSEASISSAAATISLSAIGSSIRPSDDSACQRRAIMPSIASVIAASTNNANAIQRPSLPER
jgi:hypothetical protein